MYYDDGSSSSSSIGGTKEYQSFEIDVAEPPRFQSSQPTQAHESLTKSSGQSRTLVMSFGVCRRHNELGLRVWDAAFVLCEYLWRNPLWVRGKRVLEIGAGIGLVSVFVGAVLSPRGVTATDGPPAVVAGLQANVELNRDQVGAPEGIAVGVLDLEQMATSPNGDADLPSIGGRTTAEIPGPRPEAKRVGGGGSGVSGGCQAATAAADVWLASDVLYDEHLMVCIAGVLRSLLGRRQGGDATSASMKSIDTPAPSSGSPDNAHDDEVKLAMTLQHAVPGSAAVCLMATTMRNEATVSAFTRLCCEGGVLKVVELPAAQSSSLFEWVSPETLLAPVKVLCIFQPPT
eukprot:GHVU01202159.1.p1 GENE.GHVU01202159.1~~GHVU01202159.1.p1  ORF type:complete len:345 (+),score=41.76 GHVU01202159.1:4338-5372(+)